MHKKAETEYMQIEHKLLEGYSVHQIEQAITEALSKLTGRDVQAGLSLSSDPHPDEAPQNLLLRAGFEIELHEQSEFNIERSTEELIIKLGADRDQCLDAIMKTFDGEKKIFDQERFDFHARQLIRSSFAYIEGVVFSLKLTAANKCMRHGLSLSPQERYLCIEIGYDLNDKGEVVERPIQIRLARNILFAFELATRSLKLDHKFNPSVDWWASLKAAIKIRDRFMHPRMPEDFDISLDAVLTVMKATHGFKAHVLGYFDGTEGGVEFLK